MGLLKEINDSIWEYIIEILSHISDNVYFIIVFSSFIFVLLSVCIKIKILNKKKINIMPFDPVAMTFTLSVSYMIERLPMIHPRLNLALGTVSGIIQSSTTYADSFKKLTGITTEQSVNIVSYLYDLSEAGREKWNCQPEELYNSLFSTFDKIRKWFMFPDIQKNVYTSTFMIITMIIFLLLILFIVTERMNKKRILWFSIQLFYIIYISTKSCGAFISVMLIWFIEELALAAEKKTN